MAAALPWLRPQFTDGNGKPLASGKLYFYEAGTLVPKTTYTDSTGLVANPNPVILDADGRGDVWMMPGSYKVILKDKNGVTIWTKDKVKPADGGGGGILDEDYTFQGYSARFGEQFGPSTGLMDTLDKILKFQYTAPSISFAASGANTIREKGTVVTSTTLTANVTKRTDPIALVRFKRDGALITTKTGTIPNGGTESTLYGSSFSDNTTFSAEVEDDGSSGGPTVVSGSQSFQFVYPYYTGGGDQGKTASQIAALGKRVIASTASYKPPAFVIDPLQVFYFAYPQSYGALTSILDVNNFETIADWTRTTKSITGLDGNPVNYYSYEFNNPSSAGSYEFTFKR